jgi:hypothetical protein
MKHTLHVVLHVRLPAKMLSIQILKNYAHFNVYLVVSVKKALYVKMKKKQVAVSKLKTATRVIKFLLYS